MRKLLYSNGSPFARRVRIVLFEKQLPYEADVNDALRPIDEIKAHNPALKVPVLYDQEHQFFDSNLILEYLFATYPTPSRDGVGVPLAPTVVRTDQHWDDSLTLKTIEAASDALVNVRLMAGASQESVPFIGRQITRIETCLDWLDQRCTNEGFWPGTFSVMDINLMCPLLFGESRGVFDFRAGRWPSVTNMIDHWQSRPSVAATPLNDLPRVAS